MSFSLEKILEAAASHPFYSTTITTATTATTTTTTTLPSPKITLQSFPLIAKYQLHKLIISALESDPSFLRGCYLSPTGGTTGTVGSRFFFITDTSENRRQREKTGQLMRDLGAVDENDVVLNMHSGQSLYRSLELTGELIEHARATNIPVGVSFPDQDMVNLILQLRPNVLTGTSSRILTFARYLLSHPEIDIAFQKVLYTSEPLPTYQEEYMRKALRCDSVSSLMGSAEGGIWAVAPPSKTLHGSRPYREFVFRNDMMVVEIMDDDGAPVPTGKVGEIILTSLMRLRNPLVRYRTGDVGSLHPYTCAKNPEIQYQCLHMYGRHPDKSFSISGEYVDLVELERIMQLEKWGILEWQVIVDSDHIGSTEEVVEFRVVMKNGTAGKDLLDDLRSSLLMISGGRDTVTAKFTVKAVEYAGLEKGELANKIRKIVDRR